MSLSRKVAAAALAALSLTTAFGAAAQGVNPVPSPDGRLQQCISRADFPQAVQQIGQRSVARWDADQDKTGNTTWFVREMITADINGPPSQKNWIFWTGWSRDQRANGTTPEMYCVTGSGKGIQYLNGKMPEKPFDFEYKVPANPNMGNGNLFFTEYAKGWHKIGYSPTLIANSGQGKFMTIFTDARGEMRSALTESTGSTRGKIDAKEFAFAPGMPAAISEPVRTASLDIK